MTILYPNPKIRYFPQIWSESWNLVYSFFIAFKMNLYWTNMNENTFPRSHGISNCSDFWKHMQNRLKNGQKWLYFNTGYHMKSRIWKIIITCTHHCDPSVYSYMPTPHQKKGIYCKCQSINQHVSLLLCMLCQRIFFLYFIFRLDTT